jgi:hypothetical protein
MDIIYNIASDWDFVGYLIHVSHTCIALWEPWAVIGTTDPVKHEPLLEHCIIFTPSYYNNIDGSALSKTYTDAAKIQQI